MADVSSVKENVKRAFYVRSLNHPNYLEIIATRPEIRLDKLERDSPDALVSPIMAAAHAYQISSARDELPAQYHANKDTLARAPNLLDRLRPAAPATTPSTSRTAPTPASWSSTRPAATPTRWPRTCCMMLMLSKQVVQVNNAPRKGTMQDRNLYMGNDINNKTIGIVGWQRRPPPGQTLRDRV
jgi:D-3-phosphoglycerate dehydrogenase